MAPFTRPHTDSFRLGVLDVGSNSLRFVVFEGAHRGASAVYNEKAVCGLGIGAAQTRRLNPAGKDRARSAAARFAALKHGLKLDALDAVATAALRETEDGPAFAAELSQIMGASVRVIDGPEEARLAANGVLTSFQTCDGVVADIGGSSLEVIRITNETVHDVGATTALGPQKLAQLAPDARAAQIRAELDRAAPFAAMRGRGLYLVGGAFRALATLHQRQTGHALGMPHGYQVDPAEMRAFCQDWAAASAEDARGAGVKASRAAGLPIAAETLAEILRRGAPRAVIFSASGLREGLLYDRLSPEARAADPLLSAARAMAQRSFLWPDAGEALAAWLAPVMPDAPPRLLTAACLMADGCWRVHPEYRAAAAFERAVRTELGALPHPDRMYLAAALMARRKGGVKQAAARPEIKTLCADLPGALALGRGLRAGLTLSPDGTLLPRAPLVRRQDCLELRFANAEDASRAGDDLPERFGKFAEALGLRPVIQVM